MAANPRVSVQAVAGEVERSVNPALDALRRRIEGGLRFWLGRREQTAVCPRLLRTVVPSHKMLFLLAWFFALVDHVSGNRIVWQDPIPFV